MKKFIGADREQQMLMPYDLGDWLPEKIKRREDRLSKIQEAKKVLEQRASERYQKEKE